MRINGEWLRFEDGIVRPVIRGEILGDNGLWVAAEFLVDTGADRTVISAPVLESLHLQSGCNWLVRVDRRSPWRCRLPHRTAASIHFRVQVILAYWKAIPGGAVRHPPNDLQLGGE